MNVATAPALAWIASHAAWTAVGALVARVQWRWLRITTDSLARGLDAPTLHGPARIVLAAIAFGWAARQGAGPLVAMLGGWTAVTVAGAVALVRRAP